jgi:DNA polymerase-3 subunit gamma/tau
VDQVRELRENLKYMPAHSLHKIYIIDEVHMLSTPAFNALLKTLEEPPAHILFVFATTEPHRIPVTILSRCQRYDFRRIGLEPLVNQMQALCQQEGVALAPESLVTIAREAGGSMRDALSLLDQVMACATGPLSQAEVLEVLGVVDRSVLTEIGEALLRGDVRRLLGLIDQLFQRGHDLKKLYADLLVHFRNLLMIRLSDDAESLVDLPQSEISALRTQLQPYSPEALNRVFHLLFREEASVRLAAQPRIALETVLIQICQMKPALPVDDLIVKLEALRRAIIDDGGGSAAAGGGTAPDTPEVGAPSIDRAPQARVPASPKPAPQPAAGLPPDTGANRDLVWEAIVSRLKESHPALAAGLSRGRILSLNQTRLAIEVQGNAFQINRVKRDDSLQALREVCHTLWGVSPAIEVQGKADDPALREKKKAIEQQRKQEALGHPMVAEAVKLFSGKVVDVRVLNSGDDSETS